MSRLETQVIPTMRPLIHGEPHTVVVEASRQLATWAAKTAIVAEYIPGAVATVNQASREWLMQRNEPPPNSLIWLAAFASNGSAANIMQMPWATIPAAIAPPVIRHPRELGNTQLTGISIGDMLLIVFMTESQLIGDIHVPGEWADSYSNVWPGGCESIVFDPTLSVTIEDFRAFRASLQIEFARRSMG